MVGYSHPRKTYVREKMTPRRLGWDVHPNDHLNEPALTEKLYQFFNKCKSDLLQTIIKRRQFKLRAIETHIVELQNSLLPFANKAEYKEKTAITGIHQEVRYRSTNKKNRIFLTGCNRL